MSKVISLIVGVCLMGFVTLTKSVLTVESQMYSVPSIEGKVVNFNRLGQDQVEDYVHHISEEVRLLRPVPMSKF